MRTKVMRNVFFIGLLAVLLSACITEREFKPRDSDRAAELNAELGLGYLKQGQYKRARGKLEKALEFNSENVKALHYMGELHRRLNQNEKAGEYFKQALELAPADKILLNNYGVYLCNIKKYEQAIEIFNKTLNDPLYEEKAGTYENIGLCRLWQGKIQESESAFGQALAINPKMASSLLELAKMKFDLGRSRAAYDYYSRYIAVATHTPESLWLGILLEHARGAKNTVASYKVKLKGRFPDSEETRRLKKLEAKGEL